MKKQPLSTRVIIDLVVAEFNTKNAIVIAERIEQLFSREVSIDFIEFYLKAHNDENLEDQDRKHEYYHKLGTVGINDI